HHVHKLNLAAISGHRQTAANNFAQGSEVGRGSVQLLGAAKCKPEAGHDLVEDQERIIARGNVTQRVEEAGCRRHATHVPDHGFYDHTSNLSAEFLEGLIHRVGVVEG